MRTGMTPTSSSSRPRSSACCWPSAVQVPLRMGVFSFAGVGSYGIGAYAAAHRDPSSSETRLVAAIIAHGGRPRSSACCSAWSSPGSAGLYLAMATVAFDLIVAVVAINGGDAHRRSRRAVTACSSDFARSTWSCVRDPRSSWPRRRQRARHARPPGRRRSRRPRAGRVGRDQRPPVPPGRVRRQRRARRRCRRDERHRPHARSAPQDIGFGLIVLALTMIIVGGARSWKGAVIGAIIFTWLPSTLAVVGEWQHLCTASSSPWPPSSCPAVHGLCITDRTAQLAARRRATAAEPERAAGCRQPLMAADDEELAGLRPSMRRSSVTAGGRHDRDDRPRAPAGRARARRCWRLRDVAVHFGGVKAVDGITFDAHAREDLRHPRPERLGQEDAAGAITRLTQLTRGDCSSTARPTTRCPTALVRAAGSRAPSRPCGCCPDLDGRARTSSSAPTRRYGRPRRRPCAGGSRAPADAVRWRRRGRRQQVAAAIARTGLEGFERGYPSRALLRHAAASRDRPRDRHGPTAAPARRADRRHEPDRASRDLRAAAGPAKRGALPAPRRARRPDDDRHLRLLFAMNFGKLIAEGTAGGGRARPAGAGGLPREEVATTMLEIADLHVSYGKVEAVRGVSLSVEPGKVTLVLGANGAGKTHHASRPSPGCEPPSRARSTLDGKPTSPAAPARHRSRRGMALVPGGAADLRPADRRRRTCGWARYTAPESKLDDDARPGLRRCSRSCRAASTAPPACSAAVSSRCWPSGGP